MSNKNKASAKAETTAEGLTSPAEQPPTADVQPPTPDDQPNLDTALIEENAALKTEVELLTAQLTALQEAYDQLAATPVPQPKASATEAAAEAEPEPFEIDGKLFTLTAKKVSIRKLGERTALDIISDDEPYEALGGLTIKAWLLANNSTVLKPFTA